MCPVLKDIESPPDSKLLAYIQADYVELCCLTSHDRVVTESDIISRYVQDADLNELSDFDEDPGAESNISDEQIRVVHGFFEHLEYRARVVADSYPFALDDSNVLSVKSELQESQRLYVYLLMASSLRHFEKSERTRISSSFEAIGAEALRQYMGGNATVHIFGTSSRDHYSGKKYCKITKLAEDICEKVLIPEDRFDQRDSGDAGLDIVGWLPTHDNNPGRLLIFGQCACGDRWDEKQCSSDYKKWNKLISLSIEPVNSIFIPYCFRDASGAWFHPDKIHMSLMIDRIRIMKLLDSVESPLGEMSPQVHELIDNVLSYREDL